MLPLNLWPLMSESVSDPAEVSSTLVVKTCAFVDLWTPLRVL